MGLQVGRIGLKTLLIEQIKGFELYFGPQIR